MSVEMEKPCIVAPSSRGQLAHQLRRTQRQIVALEDRTEGLEARLVGQLSAIWTASRQCCPECRDTIDSLLNALSSPQAHSVSAG